MGTLQVGGTTLGVKNTSTNKVDLSNTGTLDSLPFYACRAWVNFDGTKDASGSSSTSNTNRLIRASGNVASVLRNGTGDYTITLNTALTDANFSLNANASGDSGGIYANQISIFSMSSGTYKQAPTNNTARIIFRNQSSNFHDPEYVCVTFFR